MRAIRAQANVLARIGGLAGLYGVDLEPLYKPLSALGGALADRAMITVPHTFDRVAVTTRARRPTLVGAIEPAQLRRLDQLVPNVGDVDVELETDRGGVATMVRAPQVRPLAALSAELAALGASTAALEQLQRVGARLGSPAAIADRRDSTGAVSWTVFYKHGNDDDAEREATRARLLDAAEQLGVTVPQRSIIEGLHPVLAKEADSLALLTLGAEQTAPVLSVRWHLVRWETIIRMMLGFYPKTDAGTRLGELSGATGAEHAASMQVQFGPTEPPAMRIATSV